MIKWNGRVFRCSESVPRPKPKKTPLLPQNFVHYNNLQFAECKGCARGCRSNAVHLSTAHQVQIISPMELIQELEALYPRRKGTSRASLLLLREAHVNEYLRRLKDFMRTNLSPPLTLDEINRF